MLTDPSRAAQIASGLQRVQERISAACDQAGRSPEEITLIVVTKTYGVGDVQHLWNLGVRDVGENRDQEARPKASATAGLELRWHFVGQLQSNKARSVARYASVVHSVDRGSLVTALGKAARSSGRTVDCLIQVSLDGDVARGGAPLETVQQLGDLVAEQERLRLTGVMAVAPLDEDPDGAFALLRTVSQRLRARHPGATDISAGMSGDLESAIRQGATHLRVGSAVLGERPQLGYRRDAGKE